ncbi:MAG: diaminopimelate epimerase [Deltaproteobacteria bacterium]|jgi:diaminopimelate epimerase|nr:diaminopimelate epimerase [Deltaproteobacteria bacterium]
MLIAFKKYQAISNDYIVFDYFGYKFPFSNEQVSFLCDRRRGIGADGVLVISEGEGKAAFKMKIINSDGTIARMCGNGLRCVIKYLSDCGMIDYNTKVLIETDSGILEGVSPVDSSFSSVVKSEIGVPVVGNELHEFNGYPFTFVDVGNPHCVTFIEEKHEDLVKIAKKMGPSIEQIVEDGVNVGFAKMVNNNHMDLAVWERGAGFTNACGTGAVAAVATAKAKGFVENGDDILVEQKGGKLTVNLDDSGKAFIAGFVNKVYNGIINTHIFPDS